MSNQEIEKQTFQIYLTAVFQSENLTVNPCNTEFDDFDFKVAPPDNQTRQGLNDDSLSSSNSSSTTTHGQEDNSLSSVLTNPDEQNQQQFMKSFSSLEPTLKGVSSLLRKSDKIRNKVDGILSRPLVDFDDVQLGQQLQDFLREADLETSSSSVGPMSSSITTDKQTDIGTGEGGPKTGQKPSSTVSTSSKGKGIGPVSSSITAGKQTDIGTGKGGLKTGKKTSSNASSSKGKGIWHHFPNNSSNVATSSITSFTKNRMNSRRNTSNKPYIESTKIDVSSMGNLVQYLERKPKRGMLTDDLVNRVIPNFIKSTTQASGIARSSRSERTETQKKKDSGIIVSFNLWKEQLVNTLGQYINTLLNERGQKTNREKTANEIRNIIYKSQYKPRPK